jgi:hypothetical protein
MNDYIDNFMTYVLYVGMTSKPHQVNLIVSGLQDAIQAEVAKHHPREMEAAIIHARAQENLTHTNLDDMQDILDIDSDQPTEKEADAPSGKMASDSA